MTELTLTAIFEEAEESGYIGYIAELPGANTQGQTLAETRENLTQAIQLILSSNREQLQRTFRVSQKGLARSVCYALPDLFRLHRLHRLPGFFSSLGPDQFEIILKSL